ncbi:MAG: DUF6268 family outer membrane beta-barrel protein [Desulfocapsaceae bacterium]|nr:DUF6268 family outer membrane beta-barrel protein [Desulfocapsaceae bacterium]
MNHSNKKLVVMLSSMIVFLSWGAQVWSRPIDQGTAVDLRGTVFSIFDTDFDDGGSIRMDQYEIEAGLDYQLSKQLETGIGVSYTMQEYDFSGTSGFGGLNPWEDIHTFAVTASLTYSPDQNWSILFSPFVESSAESGADDSESYSYGGFIFASYAYSRDLVLGFGGGLTSGLEETTFIPALFVRWQISDKLLLANPKDAGPSGPAGLELSYALSPQWNFGVGAAYKSYRFRLDDEGVAPDGIGEFSGVPAWLRVSWQPTDFTTLALYGGYTFAGEIELEDRNGDDIVDDEYDPAPFASVSLEITF